jgi:hypothetical protein
MRSRIQNEIDHIDDNPTVGDVWWCDGRALPLDDGGKVRPVLLIAVDGSSATVRPLTTRKPRHDAVAVDHRAGLSWLTDTVGTVPLSALIGSLGAWKGFEAWRRKKPL